MKPIDPDRRGPQCVWATCLIGMLVAGGLNSAALAADPPHPVGVQFNRDIRPLLSEHCWKCHGFDPAERKGGLRLDDRASAMQPADSGAPALVPGNPDDSELIARITSDDPSLRMPPPGTGKRLSDDNLALLRQWVTEGATYQRHWSFEPVVSPVVPTNGEPHPIDAFVAERLRAAGESFAPPADLDTRIRRVHFDLTGLPPTADELRQARGEAWEQTVDRLLASPHFGERMAVEWLDAARYADTDGYFGDKPRQMWLWRDWVIRAFNDNLPFDQFTLEQLAGDLLPNATFAQRIATGFNRNHMSNDETGLIDEEYRVEYVADRVETTTATWLGLTVACAQCHDHKYDPISQREYYQLFAFFNNVPETGLLLGSNAPPRLSVPSPEQQSQLALLEAQSAAAQSTYEPLRVRAVADLTAREAEILASFPPLQNDDGLHLSLNGEADTGSAALGTKLLPAAGICGKAVRFDGTQHIENQGGQLALDQPWTFGVWLLSENSLGAPLSKIEPTGRRRGLEVLWQKGRLGVNLVSDWATSALVLQTQSKLPTNTWHHVAVRYDGSRSPTSVTLFVNGRPVPVDVERNSLRGPIQNSEPLRLARRDEGLGFYGSLDEFRWWPRAVADDEIDLWYRTERTRGVLERPASERAGRETEWLLDDHIDRRLDDETRQARNAVKAARSAEARLREAIPVALVMEERAEVRPTHLLERGVYNKPGERVEPGTPTALSPWPAEAPRNRLGLARWLMLPDHPLTARVAVNRWWRLCFGEGLVRTVNDFGTQGEAPTHPELLDFLAARYRENWDTKALFKLIVTSRTYQQASAMTRRGDDLFDPENRLLARGPRFRLPMEMIRDQALTASGLLQRQVGGPSVKPFQPPGLWEEVSYDADATYEVDLGPGRYRRSLYTFHKRQAPPPALLVFDGPTREKCTLKRPRTNTPLQALVLLNDVTYVEAARELARSLLTNKGTDDERVTLAVRRVLSREPVAAELEKLVSFITHWRAHFAERSDDARRFAAQEVAPAEHAVWTLLVHTLFNLDEAITRR